MTIRLRNEGRARPPRSKFLAISVLLLIGAIIDLSGLFSTQHGADREANAMTRHPLFNVSISGRLEIPADLDPNLVVAHLHFPDIPIDVFRSGKQLFSRASPDFTISLRLQSPQRPRHFSLSVSGGKLSKLERENLCLDEQGQGGDEINIVGKLPDLKLEAVQPSTNYRFPVWGGSLGSRNLESLSAPGPDPNGKYFTLPTRGPGH